MYLTCSTAFRLSFVLYLQYLLFYSALALFYDDSHKVQYQQIFGFFFFDFLANVTPLALRNSLRTIFVSNVLGILVKRNVRIITDMYIFHCQESDYLLSISFLL